MRFLVLGATEARERSRDVLRSDGTYARGRVGAVGRPDRVSITRTRSWSERNLDTILGEAVLEQEGVIARRAIFAHDFSDKHLEALVRGVLNEDPNAEVLDALKDLFSIYSQQEYMDLLQDDPTEAARILDAIADEQENAQ